MKVHGWLLLFHDHLQYLDNQCAGGVVPSMRKIKILGLNSLSRFSENLRKALYKIENCGNL